MLAISNRLAPLPFFTLTSLHELFFIKKKGKVILLYIYGQTITEWENKQYKEKRLMSRIKIILMLKKNTMDSWKNVNHYYQGKCFRFLSFVILLT